MDSYESFYRENKNKVFSYLLRMTGDYHRSFDFMQESFTRYFSRYRSGAENYALLYTIARNAVLDSIRKRQEERLPDNYELPSSGDPERNLMEKQGVEKMLAGIQQLSQEDRELIALLTTKTFSYKKIGELLNISEGNVKIRVHRARVRLKNILENGGK